MLNDGSAGTLLIVCVTLRLSPVVPVVQAIYATLVFTVGRLALTFRSEMASGM
jgi:hypothetical protein